MYILRIASILTGMISFVHVLIHVTHMYNIKLPTTAQLTDFVRCKMGDLTDLLCHASLGRRGLKPHHLSQDVVLAFDPFINQPISQ